MSRGRGRPRDFNKPNPSLGDFFVERSSTSRSSERFFVDSQGREICSFYGSGRGCKFGSSCKYLHINNSNSNTREQRRDDSRDEIKEREPKFSSSKKESKERGRIVSVNEEKGYGFISPNDSSVHGGKQLFYHISDVENNETLKERDEVEFTVVSDRVRRDEVKAVNIKLIGRVTIDAPKFSEKKADKPVKEEKLPDALPSFRPSWMQPVSQNKTSQIKEDEEVNLAPQGGFSAQKKHKTKEVLRKGLEGAPRERGVIEQVKDKFGFIRSHALNQLIFYHLNECEQEHQFMEGDEVEYYRVPDVVRKEEFKATSVRLVKSGGIFGDVSQPLETAKSDSKNLNDKYSILDWISAMSKQDSDKLLLHIDELQTVVNQDELPFTVIQPLLSLITQRSVRSSDRMDKLFSVVVDSKFMRNPRNLRSYILKLSDYERRKDMNTLAGDFEAVVILLQEIMERLQSPVSDLPLNALQSASQKLKQFLPNRTLDAIGKLLNLKEQRQKQTVQQYKVNEWKPEGEEEDFRKISVFPSTDEILSVPSGQLSSKIRPNIIDGKYRNVMHYLDTHFRLLREDCIQPLREGIKSYIATKQKKENTVSRDIRVYQNVQVRGIQCSRSNGIIYRISFQLDCEVQWEKSKRLLYGSLLCLSCDDFKTLLWATVANRDTDMLNSSRQIDIRFPDGYEESFTPDKYYTMVESSTTYFEAYQHVLKALQGLDIDNFYFADYLINCNNVIRAPTYVRPRNDTYDMSNVFEGNNTSFGILDNWPFPKIKSTLDESQMDALHQSLTKELAIVQGPPGTGKTFVGLKVMRALLDNRKYRRPKPILVICYTNHALDQFLEGIMTFEENIVRIGGRSKSEKMKEKNIRKLMYEAGKTGKQHRRTRYDLFQQLDQTAEQIQHCISDLNKQSLSFEDFKRVASEAHVQSLLSFRKKVGSAEAKDLFQFWLSETKASEPKQSKFDAKFGLDDEDEELDDEKIIEIQNDRMVGEDDFREPDEGIMQLKEDIVITKSEDIPDEILNCEDIWKLGSKERHQLYRYWLSQYILKQANKDDNLLSGLCAKYDKLARDKQLLEEELQIEVLAGAAVIGVTTTGVAKFQRLFQAVAPEVIIVEEAAEVLEAHIIAALSPSTRHLLLIGDHEQLRPSTAVYQLSTQYHLDVSLFERLIRNGIEQVTLLKQRRMRPAISQLIKFIYPNLQNHPRVEAYPNVMGVFSDIFFLTHNELESGSHDSSSKHNEFEADFISRFCNYLLLQGYKAEQITVLTAYSGQVHLLRRMCKALNIGGVRVTSVDNYQGEENDIILLSLVRNNKTGEIGFLKASNRVCVALSRAKHGLFVLGNGELLARKNDLWRKVTEQFKLSGAYGPQLKLQCQKHPTKYTMISKGSDFNNVEDGGCNEYCNQTMSCGHDCPRFCHPFPHDKLQCTKPCQRKHKGCNHPCTRRCYEDCGNCEVVVEKSLPCGHKENVKCYIPADEHTCSKPCERLLPCKKHKCKKLCGEKCGKYCHEIVEKDLKCGHIVKVECSQDISRMKCPIITCQKGLLVDEPSS